MDSENISTKLNKGNQNIGSLRYKSNSIVKKAMKLDTKLFQLRAQLKRTSSAKLYEMLSIRKSSLVRIGLGYVSSTLPFLLLNLLTVMFSFVHPLDNEKIENNAPKGDDKIEC